MMTPSGVAVRVVVCFPLCVINEIAGNKVQILYESETYEPHPDST
jgi:hypothetical protein